ncbi:MAG: N-6 DNA methylase [Myxococcales bacterium]|nr:N-6 DNA methylase [Myxococcales bacterium]
MSSERPSRQQLGQWFTPQPVADLALTLALRGRSESAEVLDPSCGDGVFLREAAARGLPPAQLIGVDVDPHAIGAAKSGLVSAKLYEGDFFDGRKLGVPDVSIIVGNPPYVRQERLDASAKEAIVESVLAEWPELGRDSLESLVGRSDLAAPFVLRLLGQLAPGGVAALVLSSAFFDSGYGAEFWRLAEQVASLRLIVDAPEERWFAEAAVHAVIAVFDAAPSDTQVEVARLNRPTSEVAAHMRDGGELSDVAEMRLANRSEPRSWSATLRAPLAWLDFASIAARALVPLGELATIRRGITSGANDIFYISREVAREWNLDSQFLRPLLTARGRAGHGLIRIDSDELDLFALVVDANCDLALHPELKRYIESFTEAPSRGTLRSRNPWWALRTKPGHVFLCKAYGERFVQPFCKDAIVADQRMYCLEPRAGVDPMLLSAVLNAMPTALALESLGRASMGQGALEWTVGDAAALPVLDIRRLANRGQVKKAFEGLASRPIGKVAAEAEALDRQALDLALLATWPKLLSSQQALTRALVGACAARQARAKAGLR